MSQLSVRQPVTALLGPRASGRSTLMQRTAYERADDIQTLSITGRQESPQSLLSSLLNSTGLAGDGLAINEMRRLLDVFIDERLNRNRVRIAIDDADKLTPDLFQEIERLQHKPGTRKPSPELLLCLVHVEPNSSAAADMVRSCASPGLVVLTRLTSNEVNWYLSWRLERFGLGGTFSPAAIRQIELCTRGCFTSINHICQLAMLLMRRAQANCVDTDIVQEALKVHVQQRSRYVAQPPTGRNRAVSAA